MSDPRPASNDLGSHDDFGRIDSWDEAKASRWAQALDLRAAADDQLRLRAAILDFAALSGGETVIEIGCGTGLLLPSLAEAVGGNGHVIGLEPQPMLARVAAERTASFAGRCQIRIERGSETTLPNRAADACIAQTVLGHLPTPERDKTVARMVRLTRAGGRVIVADQDAETWVIDHPDRELTRRIVSFYADQRFADGWTGRRLRSMLLQAGLDDVQTQVVVAMDTSSETYQFRMATDRARAAADAGWLTAAELDRWISELERLAAAGRFLTSLNFYVAAGTVFDGDPRAYAATSRTP